MFSFFTQALACALIAAKTSRLRLGGSDDEARSNCFCTSLCKTPSDIEWHRIHMFGIEHWSVAQVQLYYVRNMLKTINSADIKVLDRKIASLQLPTRRSRDGWPQTRGSRRERTVAGPAHVGAPLVRSSLAPVASRWRAIRGGALDAWSRERVWELLTLELWCRQFLDGDDELRLSPLVYGRRGVSSAAAITASGVGQKKGLRALFVCLNSLRDPHPC